MGFLYRRSCSISTRSLQSVLYTVLRIYRNSPRVILVNENRNC
jgi:hypothetical protein